MALLTAACGVPPIQYAGTGSLLVSGSPNAPQLASHAVRITERSQDYGLWTEQNVGGPAIVTIGDACTIDGFGRASAFRPEAGTLCRLDFPDGGHVIRVTDFVGHFGTRDRSADHSYVQVELGGDDTTTGRHAVHRFSGTGVIVGAEGTCDGLWARHPSKAPKDHPPLTNDDEAQGREGSWAWGR